MIQVFKKIKTNIIFKTIRKDVVRLLELSPQFSSKQNLSELT